jgi:hypothetical protein
MRRFLGLFVREWQIHYKWLLTTCIICIGVTVGIPLLIKNYIDSSIHQETTIFMMALIVCFFSFIIVCIQFFTNLKRELQHVDIWLHNPAPFYELLGAKGLFSLLTSLILNLIMSFEAVIAASIVSHFSLLTDLKFIVGMTFLSVCVLFCILPFTLLMFSCYVKLKKWIGKFSVITVLIVLFGIIYGISEITSTSIYNELFLTGMKSSGWIDNSIEPITQIFGTRILGDDVYLREDLLSLIISVLMIIVGIKWCKKVVTE